MHLFIISKFIVREIKYRRWKRAIKKCLNFNTWGSNDDVSDISYENTGMLYVTLQYELVNYQNLYTQILSWPYAVRYRVVFLYFLHWPF